MKTPKISNTAKIVGVVALAGILFSFKKYTDYSKVIEQMSFYVDKIRNLRMSGGKGYFTFDIVLQNPTTIDFTFETAGFITLKYIEIFHKGILLATATVSISGIKLPKKSGYRIEGIEAEIPLLNTVNYLFNSGLDTNFANYKARITVDALGQTFVVDQPISLTA